MRSSILMLSVALLAVLGLWMTGNANGVAVTDQEAAQLVGGCQSFVTGSCGDVDPPPDPGCQLHQSVQIFTTGFPERIAAEWVENVCGAAPCGKYYTSLSGCL